MPSLMPNMVHIATAIAILTVLVLATRITYNLLFHPLRKFPGPLHWRASRLPFVFNHVRGQLPFAVHALHARYGPVVRIAPDEVSFADLAAWRDIYGHRVGANHGAEEMEKNQAFYRNIKLPPNIISADRGYHAVLRKQLAHGFSDRAMRDQEPLIGAHVDLLVQRLKEHSVTEEGKPKALDLKTWYNWTTFDIVGDLAFGEAFGCLDKAGYHPWVDTISKTIRQGAMIQAFKYLQIDFVMPLMRVILKGGQKHRDYTADMLKRRIAADIERPDLIAPLLVKNKGFDLDFEHLQTNASLLVFAGSETTATLLSGATYLLLANPEALARLTAEIRSTFASEDDITLTSVGGLTYMLACLNEALRRYTPVPFGLPRVVPKGGAMVAGTFVPEETTVACWQWAMNHSSDNWVEPFSYKPERFLEGSKLEGDNHEALQPFSLGPRNCIGRNLAYAEMRLILARILFNFDIELVDPDTDWMNQQAYALWAKPPLNVYLKPVR